MQVRVTKQADKELAAILRWGAQHFGRAAAIDYYADMTRLIDLLATAPKMAPVVREDVRAHPYRSHVIIYRERESRLDILHIRHGHSNWRKYL